METGWIWDGAAWYYLQENGAMLKIAGSPIIMSATTEQCIRTDGLRMDTMSAETDSGFRKNKSIKIRNMECRKEYERKSLKFAGGAVIGMAAACLFSGMDAAVAQAALRSYI